MKKLAASVRSRSHKTVYGKWGTFERFGRSTRCLVRDQQSSSRSFQVLWKPHLDEPNKSGIWIAIGGQGSPCDRVAPVWQRFVKYARRHPVDEHLPTCREGRPRCSTTASDVASSFDPHSCGRARSVVDRFVDGHPLYAQADLFA
ncbi:uncharacterized protein LOC144474598 isoform X2 [Augochlora pura]